MTQALYDRPSKPAAPRFSARAMSQKEVEQTIRCSQDRIKLALFVNNAPLVRISFEIEDVPLLERAIESARTFTSTHGKPVGTIKYRNSIGFCKISAAAGMISFSSICERGGKTLLVVGDEIDALEQAISYLRSTNAAVAANEVSQ